MQCFGDSKEFEKTVKARLLGILRKYLDSDENAEDEDLLKQIGIVRYPEQFEFCGNVKLLLECSVINFSCLQCGGSICLPDLIRGEFVIPPEVERILSIENRANYVNYIDKHRDANELVIYHGGQYSPSKKHSCGSWQRLCPRGVTGFIGVILTMVASVCWRGYGVR